MPLLEVGSTGHALTNFVASMLRSQIVWCQDYLLNLVTGPLVSLKDKIALADSPEIGFSENQKCSAKEIFTEAYNRKVALGKLTLENILKFHPILESKLTQIEHCIQKDINEDRNPSLLFHIKVQEDCKEINLQLKLRSNLLKQLLVPLSESLSDVEEQRSFSFPRQEEFDYVSERLDVFDRILKGEVK